jgi:peptide/nickel transport system ATP-binding protein
MLLIPNFAAKGKSMNKMEAPFLSINNLKVIYTQRKNIIYAVNGVSLDLGFGKTLGLVGETGAGKTTIAKSILRVLPDPPAKIVNGTISLEGENLIAKTESEMMKIRGRKIAMIFQDPMTALDPLQTVGAQIMEVLLIHHNNYSKEELLDKTKAMLRLVGIPEERHIEYPHQFSGGMKQRVVIAMALACDPMLILADEPTTALDVTIQAQVLDLISELKTKNNTSMILITHDVGVVAQTCDDVAIIYAGEIVEKGSKEDVFEHASHPYTKGLFASLPSMNQDDDSKRLNPIAGMPPDPTNLPQGCKFHPRCPLVEANCRDSNSDIPFAEIKPGHFCRCIKAERTI